MSGVDEAPAERPSRDPANNAVRRRAAKLLNERLNLMATFFNGIGIATLVAMIIVPLVNAQSAGLTLGNVLSGLFFALLLHVAGQAVLTFLRSEE